MKNKFENLDTVFASIFPRQILPRKGDSTVACFLYVFLVSIIQELVHAVGFQVLSSRLFQEQLEFEGEFAFGQKGFFFQTLQFVDDI